MSLTSRWPLIAALLVSACGPGEADPEPAKPASVDAEPAGPWRIEASAVAGAALVFSDEDGVERLRVICRRAPAELVVLAASVQPIGSEERFMFGAGKQLHTLVADVTSGRPFVQAKGQLDEAVIEGLELGPIAASYGAWTLTPQTPPKPVRDDFARACRRALG